MKEIRFHGRGGQGVVKGAQTLVQSIVKEGRYAHFIPYFGVERKGSPVFGFCRIDDKDIRPKTQVYEPDCMIIFDDTLIGDGEIFKGFKDQGILIINTKKKLEELNLPSSYSKAALVDATGITLDAIKRNIPNAAMLASFVKTTGWCDFNIILDSIEESFGKKNRDIANLSYDNTVVYENH